jgi:hypothetical protein
VVPFRITDFVRGWALWRLPALVFTVVMGVYVSAGLSFLPPHGIRSADLVRFVALSIAGIFCSLACRQFERARKTLTANQIPNLVSVWTFAGVLCLDHVLAVALVVVIYSAHWLTERSLYVGKPHRYVFTAASIMVSVRVAHLCHDPLLSGLLFAVVNPGLVAAVMVASGSVRQLRQMANLREQGVEIATLVLGFVTAELVQLHLALSLAPVPVILAVQYLSLRRHVKEPSTIDAESGVLTSRAWNALGALRLAQVREAIVFVVLVQDRNGRTWRECADGVAAGVRAEDLVGRTDSGFSVLVAGPGGTLLAEVLALQVRARLAGVGIDTVLGSAVTPDGGSPVDLQGLTVTAAAVAIVAASNIGVE